MSTPASAPTPPPTPPSTPALQQKKFTFKLKFEELGVYRRAALNLLPQVQDPEFDSPMTWSKYKSSRKFEFLNPEYTQITQSGGYRLCRGTRYFVFPGSYYWESEFTESRNADSHVRLGIATIDADMEAPVGVDQLGYNVRDKGGAFHNARRSNSEPFNLGDVVGLGLCSEDGNKASLHMWINGEYKGEIFNDIDASKRWFPAASIFKDAVITSQFDKPFRFPPPEPWKAANEIPAVQPEGTIVAKELVKMMRGSVETEGGSIDPIIMNAMDTALTPAHLMPI